MLISKSNDKLLLVTTAYSFASITMCDPAFDSGESELSNDIPLGVVRSKMRELETIEICKFLGGALSLSNSVYRANCIR